MGIGKNTSHINDCMQPQVMLPSVVQPSAGEKVPSMPALAKTISKVTASVRTPASEPFRNAEEAWFWAFASIAARHAGTRSRSTHARPRPCDPDDVVKCLDVLYRRRRLDLVHARILRVWGERGVAPNPSYASERCDWQLWREAMDRLEWPLRVKGIVAG